MDNRAPANRGMFDDSRRITCAGKAGFQMLTVVSAAIVNEKGKRLLLAQRSAGASSYPHLWCTPGGHVETGESIANALARELREEIGFHHPLPMMRPVYEHKMKSSRTGDDVWVLCYRLEWPREACTLTIGDKTAGLGWFDFDTLYALRDARKLTPADEAHVDKLASLLR
jgi:8-oxo-dGTP pyrophosphatase MutT (NUDIX family)